MDSVLTIRDLDEMILRGVATYKFLLEMCEEDKASYTFYDRRTRNEVKMRKTQRYSCLQLQELVRSSIDTRKKAKRKTSRKPETTTYVFAHTFHLLQDGATE